LITLLADGSFRRVWATGGLVGVLRWLELLAISVFVLQQTGSPSMVALFTFIRLAPLFLLGALAGAVADRCQRKTLLLIGLVVLALASTVLGFLALAGRLELWHVALGAGLNGVYWSAEFPVRRTMLCEIAGPAQLGRAMAMEAATSNATRMLGPALGGFLFQFVGLHGVFFLGTALYAAGVLLIWPLRYQRTGPERARWTMLEALREGWQVVRSRRLIVAVLAVTVIVNMWGFAYITMVPVIGEQVLGLAAFPIGVLASAEGLGALIGAFAVGLYGKPPAYTRIYLYSSYVFLAGVLGFALSTWFTLSLVLMLICGLGIAGFAVMQSTILFLAAPPEVRSRVMGVLTVSIGAGPIGMLHVGFLADWLGAGTAVAIIAIEGLIALRLAALLWPEMRRAVDVAADTQAVAD